ncbi:bifunctional SulP family inorganic anion transporter/carbonic anhydrase [Urbifossiella limnaea]|uniref:Bicarbonate transporter BicA n=1 Tax=Urbifossiella limnaea TaxID=2528023 RepID=A0A517XYU1_9BACT|nr:SulP family inorganic anion transporter [Urbifossiella limnaea]QDU22684.1 Bicarbonate transporter BicA [Urbifossiella limnaea]
MPHTNEPLSATLPRDLTAGLVVFLVALPLCLGVALASGAPLLAGVIAGIVGGLLVGVLSGSHTSVAGPAAGLTAVVLAQIASLGSFNTFLLAVVVGGFIQIALGLLRAGFVAAFVPNAVIKGLLAAIGVILILKQLPHVVGHDPDPEGDMSFEQPDHENTFTELAKTLGDIHPGAAAVGILSVLLLVVWDRTKALKKSPVPAPLIVVLLGVGLAELFRGMGGVWLIEPSHLVQVPVAETLAGVLNFVQLPDFNQWRNPAVYTAAFTLAAVASLETLLNLEAVDKLDPRRRNSPPSRELFAQGVGNVASGLIGGLPVTSVIVRSSVNINAGARTRLAAIFHGVLLLGSVALLPAALNRIPLACLAAILLVTGVKLASPALARQMWAAGKYQFAPFIITVLAIVFTDLLIGVVIGLVVSTSFILWSNMRRPVRRFQEKHLGGEVVRIELANQVSFLNRAALARVLDEVPRGGRVLLDATQTDYIDPDVLELLREFDDSTGPARGVEVSLVGFRSKYQLDDRIQFVDHSTRDLQEKLAPEQVLQILADGNERFRTGRRLTRDLGRQIGATAAGQHPLAAVLSCIDSRTPAELIFDLGVGDVFSVRLAGNVTSRKAIGSIEYACAVAGAKLVVVIGHTRCGAVGAAVDLAAAGQTAREATGCEHIDDVVDDVQRSVDRAECQAATRLAPAEKQAFVDGVARRNVARAVAELVEQSGTLARLVRDGRILVVGGMYDVATGAIEFLPTDKAAVASRAP